MKKIIISLVIVFLTIFVITTLLKNKENKSTDNRIKVVTTIFPSYESVRQIAGDKVNLLQLLPPGMEAHSFEPKPSDLVRINEADIFIYTGKEMEPWVDDILKSISNKDLLVVNVSSKIQMITGDHHDHEEEGDHSEDAREEHEESLDPHIWLDFNNYKTINEQIAESLIIKDSNNKTFYEENLKTYNSKISILDEKYQEELKNCVNKKIIYGGHYAFGYMAKRYNFGYEAAQGFSPDSEPSAQDLASLVNQIKNNGIKYVYYEEMSSNKIADTLGKETGAQLLLLNAAHNISRDQINNNTSFIDIMMSNLNNLKLGLSCK